MIDAKSISTVNSGEPPMKPTTASISGNHSTAKCRAAATRSPATKKGTG